MDVTAPEFADEPDPELPAPPGLRCRCPRCTATAVVTLLETGRAAMALRLARGLPEAIADAQVSALARGYELGRQEGR